MKDDAATTATAYESRFITAGDGLRLHARDYHPRDARGLPLVCLPGLTRNATDFHDLAAALATDTTQPRRVIAIDYRGRGLSAYDPSPQNYNLMVEMGDVIAMLTALDATPAIFVGTSRGGLITMLLAAVHPRMIAGAVLNDIGPVVELEGLLRIKGYVGQLPMPKNHEEGAQILHRLFGTQFPRLGHQDWLAWSKRSWAIVDGQLHSTYDRHLADTLTEIDPAHPLPALWPQFDALHAMPLMLIRGENSDLLSRETVAEMKARHDGLELVEVSGEGHAPLLEGALIRRISAFAARCDHAAALERS